MGAGRIMEELQVAKSEQTISLLKTELNNQRMFEINQHLKKKKEVHTVCLTSMTFDAVLTEAIEGLEHYEMRCLWEISRVINEGVHVHFFTKKIVNPQAINHFYKIFNLSTNQINRIKFYSVEEILKEKNLPQDLSDYVLNNPQVRAVFSEICQNKNSYLECFVLTEKERKVSDVFNLPTYWCHENVEYLKTKSGNRKILNGVTKLPKGLGDLYSIEQVVACLKALSHKTLNRKFVIKLNDGVSGDGNGFIKLPAGKINEHTIRQSLIETDYVSSKMTYTKFFREFAKIGGVVEEFIDGNNKRSPSVQIFLKPDNSFDIISSHEQVLDSSGARFLGARFPACDYHRNIILREAGKIAKRLLANKIFGIIGLDFLTIESIDGYEAYLIEINLRKGGTTHPFWTAKAALHNAKTCQKSGMFLIAEKERRMYHSNDNIIIQDLEKTRSLSELFRLLEGSGLLFSDKTQKGAIFHMANSYEPIGKIGAVFIGETDDEIKILEKAVLNLIG